jgi:hypothetical protein
MPKDIDPGDLANFYQSGITALTGYWFELASGTEKFVANTVEVGGGGGYAPLAIKRTPIRSEEGTILNELEIGLDHVGLEFRQQVMTGKFNNIAVSIYLIFPTWNGVRWMPTGEILLFKGFTDEPKGDEHWITLAVKPFPYLDQQYPKRIYQQGCNWTFCGLNTCTLNLSSFTNTTSLGSDSDGTTLACSTGGGDDYYVPGYVEITSGGLVGEVRPILSNTSGSVVVRVAFSSTISSGVGLKIVKLCAKNYQTCQDDFSNYDNFGGYPWVPKEPII